MMTFAILGHWVWILCYCLLLQFNQGTLPQTAGEASLIAHNMASPDEAEVAQAIAQSIGALHGAPPKLADRPLALSQNALQQFYAARQFAPLWWPDKAAEAIALLLSAYDEGLTPADYHTADIVRLQQLARTNGTAQQWAEIDLLITNGLALLAWHLEYGKVNPQHVHSTWNISAMPAIDTLAHLQHLQRPDSLAAWVASLAPKHAAYSLLKTKLAFYRQIAAQGRAWPTLPDSTAKVVKGDSSGKVLALRQRLRAEQLLADSLPSPLMDEQVVAALQSFQTRYGLRPNGELDLNTHKAFNVPLAERINTLRMNLEKLRWLPDSLPAERVEVNIPTFYLQLYQPGQAAWATPVTTGTVDHQTPVFKTAIQYVELNPKWTVPPGIIKEEVIPGVRKTLNYLKRNNLKVYDRDGTEVNPATVNWYAYKGGRYAFIEPAGQGTQLGRLKLACPNPYSVYLHDTPHRARFKFMERAFSHGCVRVWEPREMAVKLLGDTAQWNLTSLGKLIDTNHTHYIKLKKHVPVYFLYQTAGIDWEGQFYFRRDVYDLDNCLLAELDKPIGFLLAEEAAKALQAQRLQRLKAQADSLKKAKKRHL